MADISNNDDIIDSRAVIERIEELQDEIDNIDDMPEGDQLKDTEEGADMREELAALLELQEQASGYADDWRHGCTLIRDSAFQDYAQEFAEDIGATPENNAWPCTCIDWERAARELQQDYTSVEFGDVTYWVR